MPLPFAPLTEQRRVVAKIEALFAQADAIEAAVNVARQQAGRLARERLRMTAKMNHAH